MVMSMHFKGFIKCDLRLKCQYLHSFTFLSSSVYVYQKFKEKLWEVRKICLQFRLVYVIYIPIHLRPVQMKEHCCKNKIASRKQKMFFDEFQKHFLLSRHRFCVFNVAQKRNHLGNTEETLTLNVSRMFPRSSTQATYVDDVEFASRWQKWLPHTTL